MTVQKPATESLKASHNACHNIRTATLLETPVQKPPTASLQVSHSASHSPSAAVLGTLPPCKAKESDLADAVRTLRYHYQLKVYRPLYRLLRLQSRRNDREDIRRKLAMGGDEDYYGGERATKRPGLSTRLQGGMNLQMCFINEMVLADQSETRGAVPDAAPEAAQDTVQSKDSPLAGDAAVPREPSSHTDSADAAEKLKKENEIEDEDLVARQARLQAEATMALAQVRPMAHMQLQVEKQMRKKSSPIAEIVGIPGAGDGKVRFSCQRLQQMNVARLQVILNDLHTQIENLNEELVHMLVERDDLHMEQDAKLIDIEDHTRRAQELSNKVNSHGNREKKKTKQKKK